MSCEGVVGAGEPMRVGELVAVVARAGDVASEECCCRRLFLEECLRSFSSRDLFRVFSMFGSSDV